MTSKDDDDSLEHTEAIPEEIPHESSHTVAVRGRGTQSPDTDRTDFGDADTDRVDFIEGRGDLAPAGKVPAQLTFTLRNIRSLNAKCFFCKEQDCDQVFMVKSLVPGKTRAYAAHSTCVFDHLQLQDLPSGSI